MDITIINTCKYLNEIIYSIEDKDIKNLNNEVIIKYSEYITKSDNFELSTIDKYYRYLYKKPINWYILGIILENTNNYSLADKIYKYALEDRTQQNKSLIYYHLVISYFKQSNFKLAEIEILHALDLNPFDIDIQLLLGIIYMEQKRYPEAERSFQMLTELKPDYADGWYNLSILYSKLHNHYNAVNAISLALYYNPNDLKAKEHLKQLTLQSSISIKDVDEIKIEDMLL